MASRHKWSAMGWRDVQAGDGMNQGDLEIDGSRRRE